MFKKIKQWLLDRAMRKSAVKEALKKKKELLQFVKVMKELYNFVKWVNTKFKNRAGRKAFWKRVSGGEDLLEKQLQALLKAYSANVIKIDEFVKPKKEEKK